MTKAIIYESTLRFIFQAPKNGAMMRSQYITMSAVPPSVPPRYGIVWYSSKTTVYHSKYCKSVYIV